MALSEKDYAKVAGFLAINDGNKGCSFCGTSNFSLHNTIYQLSEFRQGAIAVGGPLIPIVVLQCDKCGKVDFYNALHLGVVETQNSPPAKEEAK